MERVNFDAWWDYDRPDETERRFRELLPAAEADGPQDYLIELLTQIARAQGLQRQFAAAHATLDQAQRLLETGDFPRARLRYLLERGRVFNSAQMQAEALPLFTVGWELAQMAREDFYAVDAAHMMGIAAPPDEQLDWNHRALAAAEASADPRARQWMGSLYNNIGWTYHAAGRYAEALDIFQKALKWREAQGQEAPTRIARWCVARTLRSLNRISEAFEIQLHLLAELQQSGARDGYVFEELGECGLLLGQPETAGYFAQAYAELSQDAWLAANEPARLERLKMLSQPPPE